MRGREGDIPPLKCQRNFAIIFTILAESADAILQTPNIMSRHLNLVTWNWNNLGLHTCRYLLWIYLVFIHIPLTPLTTTTRRPALKHDSPEILKVNNRENGILYDIVPTAAKQPELEPSAMLSTSTTVRTEPSISKDHPVTAITVSTISNMLHCSYCIMVVLDGAGIGYMEQNWNI